MVYSKPPLTFSEQLTLLDSRGLIIGDPQKVKDFLATVSFYRLRAYTYPFQIIADPNHSFQPGTTFEGVQNLYLFDNELRQLVFASMEQIEIALRTQIIYHMAHGFGSHFYENSRLFSKKTDLLSDLQTLDREVQRSIKSEEFITHYMDTYYSPLRPPVWMSLEVASFGLLSRLFKNLIDNDEKKKVARHFGLPEQILASWMEALSHVRNICAHHGRLWNRQLIKSPQLPRSPANLWIISNGINQRRIYATLCCIKYLLDVISPNHSFHLRLKNLLNNHPGIPNLNMGFPANWQADPFWL